MRVGDQVRILARHVTNETSGTGKTERMVWSNGTVTTFEAIGDQVHVLDIGKHLTQGHVDTVFDVESALDRADQHDECARLLRTAARDAWRNIQPKG